ncbi:MAG: SWIM zinc finger family protein, partial [Actinomycetota bacterium]
MSIVVVPGQFRAQPHPVGKLASTLLSVAVAGMSDPARFRRGKAYLTDRAITRLDISPGRLIALVNGSRDVPYRVIVAVQTVERPVLGSPEAFRQHINYLTPEGSDLTVSCSCPDWDDPCKHAIAAILAFANELITRPELLVEWRCKTGAELEGGRARVGSRARPGDRHLRLAPPPGTPVTAGGITIPSPTPRQSEAPVRASPRVIAPEPPAPWENDEWQHFLGTLPPAPP